MRHFLISALLLSLVAGCSSFHFGPHRIDVQQGNVIDQESVARLKIGLNRSQVRFLLGTPLLVDPFHKDRWDYVYVNYKAGRLTAQKHITLFFDGDTLARIEGDLPVAKPADQAPATAPDVQSGSKTETPTVSPAAESAAMSVPLAPQAAPVPVDAAPVVSAPPSPVQGVAQHEVKSAAVAAPAEETAPAQQPSQPSTTSSIVAPLPSPNSAPAAPRSSAGLGLQPETDVAKIQPDVIPPFPAAASVTSKSDVQVLNSVKAWADAWAQHDYAAYFAAYDQHFVPQDGASRAKWEQAKRQAMEKAKNIQVKIESPSVERTEEGAAKVTFKQFYRSDSYRDAVLKQLLMVEHGGRWQIVEEKVLSTLRDARP
jgi:outer membrane protein assembly factor BamE